MIHFLLQVDWIWNPIRISGLKTPPPPLQKGGKHPDAGTPETFEKRSPSTFLRTIVLDEGQLKLKKGTSTVVKN